VEVAAFFITALDLYLFGFSVCISYATALLMRIPPPYLTVMQFLLPSSMQRRGRLPDTKACHSVMKNAQQ
jgi:hypothetical protein